MTTKLHTVALFIIVLCAYVWMNDPGHVFHNTDGASVNVEAYAPDNTSGNNIFNPDATLDSSQIDYADDTRAPEGY